MEIYFRYRFTFGYRIHMHYHRLLRFLSDRAKLIYQDSGHLLHHFCFARDDLQPQEIFPEMTLWQSKFIRAAGSSYS